MHVCTSTLLPSVHAHSKEFHLMLLQLARCTFNTDDDNDLEHAGLQVHVEKVNVCRHALEVACLDSLSRTVQGAVRRQCGGVNGGKVPGLLA